MSGDRYAPPVTSNSILSLLSKGFRFKRGSKLAHLMKAFHDELQDMAQAELDTHGYIEVQLPSAKVLKYTYDSTTSSWQQVI